MRLSWAPPKERLFQQAAVFTAEGNALGHALVNDVGGNFRQAVDVGFTGAEVAALHGVIEQAVDGVAVVLVVLGRVDAALGRNGVGAAGAVLVAEALDVVAKLGKRGGGGGAGQAGPTTSTVYLRLLFGLISLDSSLYLDHLS